MQINQDDFLMFMERAIDGMMNIVEGLGDEKCNVVPNLPGANSPYAILFHCVGMTNFWMGNLIGGRNIERDREAEFRAQGTVEEIRQLVDDLKARLREDVAKVQGDKLLSDAPPSNYNPAPDHQNWTQGSVLIHTFEELAQHHGQMELTRDIIMSGRA